MIAAVALLALVALLAFAAGWVACCVYAETCNHRRGGLLDFTGVPPRRDLWTDERAPKLVTASPIVIDFRQAQKTGRCDPDRGVHYHGSGDRCQCGSQANVVERGR